jgi:UDP-N-acetylglucosamine 1-carboxyvinyltransferase
MPAWDEALTYIVGAGVTGGEVCVQDFSLAHIRSDVEYMKRAGMDVFEWGGNVYASGKNKSLQGFDLFTAPYPGVNSDLQPIFAVLASQCRGESSITDQRFTERFQYIAELKKLGADIEAYGNCAVMRGPSRLKGAWVKALDLRCGGALVLAALAAHGETTIDNCYQLGRGYEFVVERLRSMHADIEASP